MTKTEAKKLLGFKSDAQLARLFEISRAAVNQWPANEAIPELQYMRLRYELKPELFSESKRAA